MSESDFQVTHFDCGECGAAVTGRTYHTYLHCLVHIHQNTDRQLTSAQLDRLVDYAKEGKTWNGNR